MRTYNFIGIGLVVIALAAALDSRATEDFSAFLKGGWSDHVTQNEFYGFIYRENNVARDPFQSLKAQGWNYAGLALFTCTNFNPLGNAAVNDLGVVITQARLAKAAGLKIALNLLYRDNYSSAIPAGWPTNYTDLQVKVYDYTMSVMTIMATNGVTPDMVKVENEVDHNGGILLPVGVYDTANFYGLLKAGCQAVKDFDPNIPRLIHTAGGNNYMIQKCINAGVPFDVYAISYYPVWGGTIAALPSKLNSWATLGKRIMLIETAKQWSGNESDSYTNLISNEAGYTNNPVAAFAWYHDLEQKLAANSLGAGVFIWPTTLTSTAARPVRWDNTALWDSDTGNFQPIPAAGLGGTNPSVSLYSCAAGKYVTVDAGGNLIASATSVDTNEQFNLVAQSQGYVSLVSKRTGKFVTANATQVTANASSVADAQKWRPDSHAAGYETGNVAIAMFSKSLSKHLDATATNNWKIGCAQKSISGTSQQFWISAATYYVPPMVWTNPAVWSNPSGGDWMIPGNWSNGAVALGADVTADFGQLNITTNSIVNLNSARTIGNLIFGDTDPSTGAGWVLTNLGLAGNILTLAGSTPTITVNALGAGKSATISAVIAGSAGLNKAGSGTLVLTGVNTYTGGTTISNGTVSVTADSGLGAAPGSATPGSLVLDGGALAVAFSTLNANRGMTLGVGGSTLIKANPGRLTYSGIIAGPGALTFNGAVSGSDFAPSGGSTYAGGATLTGDSGATVVISGGSTGTPGSLTAGPFGTGPVILNGLGIRSGTGTGSTTVGNAISFAANTTFPTAAPEKTLLLSGPVTLAGGDRTLTVNIGNSSTNIESLTISGAIGDGGNGYGLTKAGTGVLKLSGTNTFTGNTVITAGTLALVASFGSTSPLSNSPNISVSSGATLDVSGVASGFRLLGEQVLGGSGSVAGSLLVASNAVVMPGPSMAKFSFINGPVLQGKLLMEINRTNSPLTCDQLVVAGQSLTLGGVLTVTNLGEVLQLGDSFVLLSASAINGNFAAVQLPALPAGLTWNTAALTVNGTISVMAMPASVLTFLAPNLAGNSLILTGANGPVGGKYYVLTTTNIAVSRSNWTILATNYFDANGGFACTNPINPAKAGEFFRLQVP